MHNNAIMCWVKKILPRSLFYFYHQFSQPSRLWSRNFHFHRSWCCDQTINENILKLEVLFFYGSKYKYLWRWSFFVTFSTRGSKNSIWAGKRIFCFCDIFPPMDQCLALWLTLPAHWHWPEIGDEKKSVLSTQHNTIQHK